MGSQLSTFDEAKQARMQEIISDFIKEFSRIFPVSYKEALIESIKENAQPDEDDERQLPDIPTPEDELLSGNVTKQCAFAKNWKLNYFVALNKVDNYRIDYYEKEGGTLRGSIHCSGYSPKSDDEGALAPYGIRVVPSDESRRTYYMKFETAEEKEAWMEVLKNACKKAGPPENEDKLLAKAFGKAYRALRWHFGYYGSFRINYSEAEQLGELCESILYRELIQEVLDSIPQNPLRKVTEKAIRKMVRSTVMTSVGSAWASASAACRGVRAEIENAATSLLEPLFEQEVILKERIAESVNEKVDPFLNDVGGKVCSPVLKACGKYVAEAYVSAIEGFATHMRTQISEGNCSEERILSTTKRAHNLVDCTNVGPVKGAHEILMGMYEKELEVLGQVLGGDFTLDDIVFDTMDAIRDLSHRGVHAFYVAISESGEESKLPPSDILSEVLSRFSHDAKLSMKSLLCDILGGVLQSPLEDQVIAPSSDLVAPLQETVESIPVPGVADLIDLSSLTEDVIQRSVDDSIGTLVETSFADLESDFDTAVSKLESC